ncbi:MAG: Arc family DNA-binding protein [Ruminococcaceae bacterium]|nr:Arc family DNA-binding protein [Oscillospiraceae bacterium]
MENNEKHFGLRVDGTILAKFRYVCGYHGRSANSQIIQLMLQFIADYERENGKIPPEDLGKKFDLAK